MSTQEKQSLHPENTVFTSPGRRPWWRCLWKTWLTWPQQVIPRSKWDDRKPRFFPCRSSTSKWLIKCMMPRLAAKRLAQIGWKKNRRKTCGWKCCSLFSAAKSTCSECLFQLKSMFWREQKLPAMAMAPEAICFKQLLGCQLRSRIGVASCYTLLPPDTINAMLLLLFSLDSSKSPRQWCYSPQVQHFTRDMPQKEVWWITLW